MNKKRILMLLTNIFLLIVISLLAACAAEEPVAEAPTEVAAEPTEEMMVEVEYEIPETHIVLGNYPVFDLGPWVAAEHWGYLDDMNMTLEHKVFPDERSGLQALASESSHLQLMGDLSLIGVSPTFSDFRAVFVPNVFQGFAPLIRPDGDLKTYEQMKEEISDPEEALHATCAQVEGKTWVAQLGASHETTVDATLECGGLTRDDLDFIDIGPAEGATAFLRGEGDIYLGDVPNRYRLEEEGMVPLLTAGDLGQKAAAYVTIVGNSQWLSEQENEDAVLRLMLVWFKALDEIKAGGSRAEEAYQVIADWVNEGAGTSFSAEAAEFIFWNIYIPQPSFDEMVDVYFTPGSPFNWMDRLEWGVEVRAEQGQIEPGEVDPTSITVKEELFRKLLDYKEQAEIGISEGGPYAELAKEYYDKGYYLDAAKILNMGSE